MTNAVFVDTNVHFYAFDDAEPPKRAAAQAWRNSLWSTGRGRTSFQVLQEFYYQASKQFPAAESQIRAEVNALLTWDPVEMNGGLLRTAWDIQDRYRMSFWDALIVAAARAASCRYLLSEDFQGGQNLDGVEVVNPFQRDFDSLDA